MIAARFKPMKFWSFGGSRESNRPCAWRSVSRREAIGATPHGVLTSENRATANSSRSLLSNGCQHFDAATCDDDAQIARTRLRWAFIICSTASTSAWVYESPLDRWQSMHQTRRLGSGNIQSGRTLAGTRWSTLRSSVDPQFSQNGDCWRSRLLSRVHRAVCRWG